MAKSESGWPVTEEKTAEARPAGEPSDGMLSFRQPTMNALSRGPGECLHHSPTGDELDDEHYDSDNQEEMNQTPGHMEAESENPQDEQDDKDRPEHARPPFRHGYASGINCPQRMCRLDADSNMMHLPDLDYHGGIHCCPGL